MSKTRSNRATASSLNAAANELHIRVSGLSALSQNEKLRETFNVAPPKIDQAISEASDDLKKLRDKMAKTRGPVTPADLLTEACGTMLNGVEPGVSIELGDLPFSEEEPGDIPDDLLAASLGRN